MAVSRQPVDELTLVPLTEQSAGVASGWFAGDSHGTREFGGFYGNHPRWWLLVDGHARCGYIALLHDEPVGFVDLELGDLASFAFYVRPEWRGRGIGSSLARAAATAARAAGAVAAQVGVRADNVRSLAACRRAGFSDVGVDEDGYVMLYLQLGNGDFRGRDR